MINVSLFCVLNILVRATMFCIVFFSSILPRAIYMLEQINHLHRHRYDLIKLFATTKCESLTAFNTRSCFASSEHLFGLESGSDTRIYFSLIFRLFSVI